MGSSIISERLLNQRLTSSTFHQPVDVVRWLGAVQSQDFNAAKWALGLRMPSATNAVIEDAFNRGEIVRTHVLRPTWHFVAPEDIRWMLALTGPRVNLRCGSGYRMYELDEQVLKRTNSVIAKALKNGKHRTRSELKAILNRAGVAADDSVRMGHILIRAELDGVVCSGPLRDKQFTYALFDERVPAGLKLSGDEALAELARRYFTSHGPATLADFVWWSGLTTEDARRGMALVDGQLNQTPNNAPGNRRSAHLLPAFDEYTVAYKNREILFDPDSQMSKWDAIGPTIIVNGKIVGRWKSKLDKKAVTITVNAAKTLKTPEQQAIAKAAKAHAAFYGLPVKIS